MFLIPRARATRLRQTGRRRGRKTDPQTRGFPPRQSRRHQFHPQKNAGGDTIWFLEKISTYPLPFSAKKVRANDIMAPPNETSAEIGIQRRFCAEKIAAVFPAALACRAVKSQRGFQIHERAQTKIFSLRS